MFKFPDLKKLASKISDGLEKAKNVIVRHATNIEETFKRAVSGSSTISASEKSTESAGGGDPIAQPIATGLAQVEKKFNKAINSPKLPRALVRIYLADAAAAMAEINDTPITEEWQTRKEALAEQYEQFNSDPNYFMSGQFEELVFSNIELGTTKKSATRGKAISMIGLLVVGYRLYYPRSIHSPYHKEVSGRKKPYLQHIGQSLVRKGTILNNTESKSDHEPYFGMTDEGSQRVLDWTTDYLSKFHKELKIGGQFARIA